MQFDDKPKSRKLRMYQLREILFAIVFLLFLLMLAFLL